MFGRIMPAPLLMPVTVTVRPPICTLQRRRLGHGVGRHDRLGGAGPVVGRASASAAGRPASMRSTGSVSMITPVENGSTCSGATAEPRGQRGAGRARARQAVLAGAGVGVAGVDDDRARRRRRAARCSRHSCTGAAQKRFGVKTPATDGPRSSSTTVRSRRLALRIAGHGGAELDAGDGMQGGGVWGGKVDGHDELPMLNVSVSDRTANLHQMA